MLGPQNELKVVKLSDYQPADFNVSHHSMRFVIEDDFVLLVHEQVIDKQKAKAEHLVLNGEDLALLEIRIDDNVLEKTGYSYKNNILLVYDVPKHFVLTTVVKLFPEQNTELSGLYSSNGILCTQCEAEGFRRISFSLDRPDVLSTFRVRIECKNGTVPTAMLSNGNCEMKGVSENGFAYAQWYDPHPKPTYLFALVVGDLAVRTESFVSSLGKNIRLSIYTENAFANQTDIAMNALIDAINWDEKRFGFSYDLEEFNIVAISDFNMGAMENKSLNIFNTKYVLGTTETATDNDILGIQSVIGHEYFHNWTGNRITCRDWFQLSLKEGLTVFREQEFASDLNERSIERIKNVNLLRKIQFIEDAGPMQHPVQPQAYAAIDNFYTATVYEKGAEIIRMYHTIMGEDKFQKGMELYVDRFDGQAVRIEDFAKCMEDASDFPFTEQFFKWYTTSGTPRVKFALDYIDSEKKAVLKIEQEIDAVSPPTVLTIPIKLAFLNKNGETYHVTSEQGNTTFIMNNKYMEVDFHNIQEPVIPVLMLGFSAPIRYSFFYSFSDLRLLVKSGVDGFARNEAMQQYYRRVFAICLEYPKNLEATLRPLAQLMEFVLWSDKFSNSEKALLLTFPDINSFIGYVLAPIDIESVSKMHENLVTALAKELGSTLLDYFKAMPSEVPADYSIENAGARAMVAVIFDYLARTDIAEIPELISDTYYNANCMTTLINMVDAVSYSKKDFGSDLLLNFYDRYKSQPLVIDKWFSVQAKNRGTDALAKLEALSKHKDFNKNNPNRFRSLIGSFMQNNWLLFHKKDGSGYRFVIKQIESIINANPQLAARMLAQFSVVTQFESEYQQALKSILSPLLEKEISTDVKEILNKIVSGLK